MLLSWFDYTVAVKIVTTYTENQTIWEIFEEIHLPWDRMTTRVEYLKSIQSWSGAGIGTSVNSKGGLLIDWVLPL